MHAWPKPGREKSSGIILGSMIAEDLLLPGLAESGPLACELLDFGCEVLLRKSVNINSSSFVESL